MAGLKKTKTPVTSLSKTAVVGACVCDGACWKSDNPQVQSSWLETSKKVSIARTVTPS